MKKFLKIFITASLCLSLFMSNSFVLANEILKDLLEPSPPSDTILLNDTTADGDLIRCNTREFFGHTNGKDYWDKIHSIPLKDRKNRIPTATQITRGVYLGGLPKNPAVLRKLGITHVINCCEKETYENNPVKSCDKFKILHLDLKDEESQDIGAALKAVDRFFEETPLNHDSKILVHCFQGVSRSATVMIYLLMKFKHFRYDAAFEYVDSKRPILISTLWRFWANLIDETFDVQLMQTEYC